MGHWFFVGHWIFFNNQIICRFFRIYTILSHSKYIMWFVQLSRERLCPHACMCSTFAFKRVVLSVDTKHGASSHNVKKNKQKLHIQSQLKFPIKKKSQPKLTICSHKMRCLVPSTHIQQLSNDHQDGHSQSWPFAPIKYLHPSSFICFIKNHQLIYKDYHGIFLKLSLLLFCGSISWIQKICMRGGFLCSQKSSGKIWQEKIQDQPKSKQTDFISIIYIFQ